MLAVISVALFALAVSAAPPALQTPVAFTPLQHHPGAHYHQDVPATRATFVPQHYQVSAIQPAHLTAYHYQAQPQLMRFAAPAAPVVHAAPKPILKEYNIHTPQPQLMRFAAPAAPVVHAAPKPILKEYNIHAPQPQWAILRSNLDNNFDGHFQYDFETENGISMASSGALRQVGPEAVGQVMQGQYSYTTPEGQVITTTYTADENGFVASGDHLPQAPVEPELPPLIAKSLAYIRSIPPRPEFQQ